MVKSSTDSLVKFCDAQTAEKILSSQALRWSAPHLFSDPFELHYQSLLSFSQDDLLVATVKSAINLIFSPENPVGSTPMLQAIRRWRAEDRFQTPEEAQSVLHGLLAQMVSTRQQQIELMMHDWRDFTQRLRICCFSAKVDNLNAWRQYADHHRGVALRFRTDEDGGFSEPMKVSYQDYRPEITRIRDQVEAIVKNSNSDPSKEFRDKFLIKSKAFTEEREWRCMRVLSEKSHTAFEAGSAFSDIKFSGRDLAAIYFGVSTPPALREKLTKLAGAINPKIRIFSGNLQPYSFDIEFQRQNPPGANSNHHSMTQASLN